MTPSEIEILLRPYLVEGNLPPAGIYDKLDLYLQLLLKWNARTNLTAIREPEEIVRRHFGESLFAAQHLKGKDGSKCETLLDFGSGAGFPGLPIQLFHPSLQVTLAESQNKKASFLREAVRTLGLKTEVWAERVEAMPATRRFDVVTLRAVDNMDAAIAAAGPRTGKRMMLLTTAARVPSGLEGFTLATAIPLPGANEQQFVCLDRGANQWS